MTLPAGVRSVMVETDRLNTHILAAGPEDGTPVLLVHGNVSSNRFYDELIAALPDRYRIVAPDLRGYGLSERKPVDATRGVRDWSDDLRSLIVTLGWAERPVHIMGWSLGGGVVMQYAIDHADNVASLTLMAPMSPYGFGGTHGSDGQLNASDGAALEGRRNRFCQPSCAGQRDEHFLFQAALHR
jgi:pimeloyl-ACP methyl ester carboxylesterase